LETLRSDLLMSARSLLRGLDLHQAEVAAKIMT